MLKIPEGSPAAQWTSAGRSAAAGILVLGAAFELAANSIVPDTDSALDAVQWVADNRPEASLASVSAILAVPFLLATTLVYVLLARRNSPRLAYTAGVLLAIGVVGLSAVEGYEALAVTLAQDTRFDLTTLAEVVDEGSSAPAVAMQLIAVPFLFCGFLVSAAALWRSDAVPQGAVLLILAFVFVDVFLNEAFGIAPDFLGPAISFVAACWIAGAVLRAGRGARAT